MKSSVLYILFGFLAINTMLYSQVGGRSTYQFLNIVSSPIQDALGGRIITSLGNDVNQASLNPSLINPEINNRVGLNYGNYFSDINFGNAAFGYSWGEKNKTIQTNITYINYGEFQGTNEFGDLTGSFTGSEVALSGGYAYELPIEGLVVGANAKLISSVLDVYSSFGGALDLAASYQKKENKWIYSVAFRNIGMQFTTYAGVRENIPFEIVMGVSNKLKHAPIRWHVTLQDLQRWQTSYSNDAIKTNVNYSQTSFFENALHHVNLGAEIFPEKIITIRVGYNFRRSYELSLAGQNTFAGLSTGFGIRLKRLRFDYSYSRYTTAGATSLFGTQFYF